MLSVEIIIPEADMAKLANRANLAALCGRIAATMTAQNALMLAHVTEFHFRGKGPNSLAVRTGRLWKSLRTTAPQIQANSVVSSLGTNVKYAGVHEFGFSGTVNVPPHMRKKTAREVIFGKRRKVRKGDVAVSAHTMRMNVPKRAPIRSGIEEYRQTYVAALKETVTQFLRGQS